MSADMNAFRDRKRAHVLKRAHDMVMARRIEVGVNKHGWGRAMSRVDWSDEDRRVAAMVKAAAKLPRLSDERVGEIMRGLAVDMAPQQPGWRVSDWDSM